MRRVYFARSETTGLIKIGTSANVRARLLALSREHKAPMTLIRAFPAGLEAEQWLLRNFRGRWISGEWFKFCNEMLTCVVPFSSQTGIHSYGTNSFRRDIRPIPAIGETLSTRRDLRPDLFPPRKKAA